LIFFPFIFLHQQLISQPLMRAMLSINISIILFLFQISAHASISHHNIIGDRYKDQRGKLNITSALTKSGFQIESLGYTNTTVKAFTTYSAPSMVTIDALFGQGAVQTLELYVTPSRPGFCYHTGRMVVATEKGATIPPLLKLFTLPMPTWFNHLMAARFLNQDGLFLHEQEKALARTGKYSAVSSSPDSTTPFDYTTAVYAANSDLGVLQYRTWIRKLAGGFVPYRHNHHNTLVEPSVGNVVFDQWNGHTKYCSICQSALKNIRTARFASFVVAALMAVVRPGGVAGGVALSSLFAGVGLICSNLIKLFYVYEFSHATND
jgi:Pheophorbide a oxygenase